uniref:Uncharacterized protein n=1 Tax=Arundo donax TaxID=35708 RepID=A0A0A8ZN80_ARUDO
MRTSLTPKSNCTRNYHLFFQAPYFWQSLIFFSISSSGYYA